jgi:hypothetical protein
VPRWRSVSIIVAAAASAGITATSMIDWASTDQTNSGSLPHPIPGARMFLIVTIRLTAPNIEDRPVRWIRKIQASWPLPGTKSPVESGV